MNPSMFQASPGSAPDIAGQGIADPTATVISVAMLLAHLGGSGCGEHVERAVATRLATGRESSPPAGWGADSRFSSSQAGRVGSARLISRSSGFDGQRGQRNSAHREGRRK